MGGICSGYRLASPNTSYKEFLGISAISREKMSFKSDSGPRTRPSPVRSPLHSPAAAESDSGSSDSDETFHDAHFPPDEEASLLAASNTTKAEANTLFSQARYSEAISTYDRALGLCPNYLDYEIAVLQSNISACHLKLEEWKQAVEAANAALDGLNRIDPSPNTASEGTKNSKDGSKQGSSRGQEPIAPDPDINGVVELAEDEDDSAALEKLAVSDARKTDISRIRAKSLMRRARARVSLSGWANLAGAEEDYKTLASDPKLSSILPQSDMKVVRASLRDLPPKIAAAKEKEMGEMMGKLKELGNGILRPFGLSTDNFKMVKDEKTGGYSVNFEQGAKT
jgi:tetratricopeptide (TPR) repeat protein